MTQAEATKTGARHTNLVSATQTGRPDSPDRTPFDLVSPDLNAVRSPSLERFIESHFEALSPYLNWFTVELFHHHGVAAGLDFLDQHASKRISTQRVLSNFGHDARFTSVVLNNAGANAYIEVQSKSGFIESLRRFLAAQALSAGASTAEVAHMCGASMRTIQRLQRTGAGVG